MATDIGNVLVHSRTGTNRGVDCRKDFQLLDPSDVAGVIGSGIIVTTYALSQAGRMDVRRPAYPALNALGAALVILSLVFKFNLAAMLVEGFWCVISAAGLLGSLRRRGAGSDPPPGTPPADLGQVAANESQQDIAAVSGEEATPPRR